MNPTGKIFVMSVVDNCILSFGICESEDIINAVNSFFTKQKGFISIDDPSLPVGWYGGTKMMEANLFIAAFNYFRENQFIKHLKSIKWRYPSEVQLIIKRDDEETFSIVSLDDPF